MAAAVLHNAPLKEVLLELHWDLDFVSEEKILIDRGFEQAVLRFLRRCKDDFGEVELLKPENIPPLAFPHKVTHRFSRGFGKHPIMQLGPGVFTVNDDNKNYVWHDFRELIEYGVSCLLGSYDKELVLSKVELRYIDRCSPYVFEVGDKFKFLQEHLNIDIGNDEFIDGDLRELHVRKLFDVGNNLALNTVVTTGIDPKTGEDIVEWHTAISSRKRLHWEDLLTWIDQAHEVTSLTFKKMLSDELYEYFSRQH